jgi:hypothetical protein
LGTTTLCAFGLLNVFDRFGLLAIFVGDFVVCCCREEVLVFVEEEDGILML